MRADDYGDEHVALRAAVRTGIALSAQGYGLSVVDTGGDADAYLMLLTDIAHAAAGGAGLMDYLARASALRARRGRLRHTEGGALRRADAAGALTVGADLRRRPRRAAVALAVRALLDAADGDFLLATESGLLKADVELNAYVVALARRVRVAARAAAEAEYVSEYIAKVAEIAEAAKAAEACAAAKARAGIKGRMAVLVILRALIVVRQHLVRLVDLLEPLLTGFIARMEVGVVLLGKFAVCFFYLICRGALLQAEHLVVISFFCHILDS